MGVEESCFLLQELLLLQQRLLNYDEVMQQLLDGEQRQLVPNWYDGLVEWFHGWKGQIHQQCSCPISGQGVLICSEASIHSAHQHYFLTSHTPTAPHQCLGQVEKIEKG